MRTAHRPVRVALVAVALGLASTTPVWAAQSGEGRTISLVTSNGLYCRQAPCTAVADAGYVRLPSGPVAGTDNARAVVEVSPGDTVTWTYRDTGYCDPATQPTTQPFYDCKGHEVRFENGSPEGAPPIGFLPARSGLVTISWTVPPEARPGSIIRYFCGMRDGDYPAGIDVVTAHYPYGMTGIFEVV